QRIVILVQHDGSASCFLELHGSAHMIDVRVGHNNLLELELMLAEKGNNALDFVARIDNQSLPRGFIADNRAIAAEHSDGKYLVNQRPTYNTCAKTKRARKPRRCNE